jgi:hypothetical protein
MRRLSALAVAWWAAAGASAKFGTRQGDVTPLHESAPEPLAQMRVEDIWDWQGCQGHTAAVLPTPPDVQKRIAIALRGEAFRGDMIGFRDRRVKAKTDLCQKSSIHTQMENAEAYVKQFEKLEQAGYAVDVFLATYECTDRTQNHLVLKFIDALGLRVRRFTLLSQADGEVWDKEKKTYRRVVEGTEHLHLSDRGFSQGTSLQAATDLVASHMCVSQHTTC